MGSHNESDRPPRDNRADRVLRVSATTVAALSSSPSPSNQPIDPLSPLEAILATAGAAPQIELRPTPTAKAVDISRLKGKKAQALILLLQGERHADIAEKLNLPEQKISKFAGRAEIKQCLANATKHVLGKLQRGEFGPIPMARHAAEHSMATLIELTKRARNENVKRQAAIDVLALAGHVAVKKAEILNVNELIDAMNAVELEDFIRDGKWPDRLRDRAALLSITKKSPTIDITPR